MWIHLGSKSLLELSLVIANGWNYLALEWNGHKQSKMDTMADSYKMIQCVYSVYLYSIICVELKWIEDWLIWPRTLTCLGLRRCRCSCNIWEVEVEVEVGVVVVVDQRYYDPHLVMLVQKIDLSFREEWDEVYRESWVPKLIKLDYRCFKMQPFTRNSSSILVFLVVFNSFLCHWFVLSLSSIFRLFYIFIYDLSLVICGTFRSRLSVHLSDTFWKYSVFW